MARMERALGSKRGDLDFVPAADLNEDGRIDDQDKAILLNAFGQTP